MGSVLVTQASLTLCDPMECSHPSSSVHGILQARILEWVAIPFSRGSSQLRDWTQVSCIAGRFFTVGATREGAAVGNWGSFTLGTSSGKQSTPPERFHLKNKEAGCLPTDPSSSGLRPTPRGLLIASGSLVSRQSMRLGP